jgi:hypothetical protein
MSMDSLEKTDIKMASIHYRQATVRFDLTNFKTEGKEATPISLNKQKPACAGFVYLATVWL